MEITADMLWKLVSVVVIPALGGIYWKISKLNDKVDAHIIKSIKADESNKKHILACMNYEPKPGSSGLLNS